MLLVSLCFLIGCPSKQPTDTRPVVAGMNASLKYTLEESILKPYWERGRAFLRWIDDIACVRIADDGDLRG